VLFCLTATLQKALKHVYNRTKIAYKTPKHRFGWGSAQPVMQPQTPLGTLQRSPIHHSRQRDRINFYHCVHYDFTSCPVSPPWKKLDRNCIRHNALANYSNTNTTKSDSEKGIRKGYFVVKTPVKILISRHYYSVRVLSKHGLWKNMKVICHCHTKQWGSLRPGRWGRGLDRDVPDCGY